MPTEISPDYDLNSNPLSKGHHNGSGQVERLFFDEQDVTITQSRFVTGEKTYTIDTISSVSSREITTNTRWSWVVTGLGILILLLGISIRIPILMVLGAIMVGGAGLRLLLTKTSHAVVIQTGAGETHTAIAGDKFWVERIVKALNDAIEAQ